MATKILVIKTNHYCECDYGDCCCDPEITTQELDVLDLADSKDYDLRQAASSLALKALESDDENLHRLLRQKGWVNIQEIKDREEKLAASKQYWYYQGKPKYGMALHPIDLEHISVHTARQLADEETHVVQAVTKTSLKKLFDREQKEAYDQEAARLKKEKAKRAAAAKARRDKKKQKELEKARKVLEEAGELNDSAT
jgi:hypothetical protein